MLTVYGYKNPTKQGFMGEPYKKRIVLEDDSEKEKNVEIIRPKNRGLIIEKTTSSPITSEEYILTPQNKKKTKKPVKIKGNNKTKKRPPHLINKKK